MNKYEKIVLLALKNNPCEIEYRHSEAMSAHTTFKVGGNADFWLRPSGGNFPFFLTEFFKQAKTADIPVWVLGGGANILVSDNGIRGIVLDTGGWAGASVNDKHISFRSGTPLDGASEIAAAIGLSGLEFLAGMPGSIGGGVWMNARCYGSEVSDILSAVEIIDYGKVEPEIIKVSAIEGFAYKKSPFQGKKQFILSAEFNLKADGKQVIRKRMGKNRADRKEKGHYLFPCAGSAFKNNRDFGKPAGQIIDELGLRGRSIGGAQIAPFHGNIIINTGNATASDIRALMDDVAAKVKDATNLTLEPEVLLVGGW
ncbi:MAG: UDP-N-acetylmuramate dehydrogenase [Treponema sp.]|jgi:UDP-N-acetylmuramate dehydrogenase|nr:UDP-N-acetylmuramate dehydrogenase [Treponema sp.]